MNDKLESERKIELNAVISFMVILGIIGITFLGLVIFVFTKPTSKEVRKEKPRPAVELTVVSKANHVVEIRTDGVVESLRETSLATEVQGRVVEISPNFKRGGRVKEGEVLVKLDPADYQSALATAEVAAAEASLGLEQERARVEQAQLDWNKLGRGEPRNELVLRAPYLKAAEAKLNSAKQQAEKARRDLERTEIVAPFDAGVRSANAEVGAVVAPGSMIAELYSNGEIEVRLPLSLEDFGFLNRDASGNIQGNVTLKGKIGIKDYEWTAVPVRVDPEIDRKTLSASVVVKVLASENPEFPLPPVGMFVDVRLGGKNLENVVEIPRRALLDGQRVIVVGEKDKIIFRDVRVLRTDEKTVLIGEGLEAGERVVLTRLSSPVIGMEVTVEKPKTKEEK
ncbi:MAG: efflux RND transporter periplasmic adaptor subunit [Verrucomicrobiota bacterium]